MMVWVIQVGGATHEIHIPSRRNGTGTSGHNWVGCGQWDARAAPRLHLTLFAEGEQTDGGHEEEEIWSRVQRG